MKLDELISHLDGLLDVAAIKDYPNALNGLQVENAGEVSKVVVAVDACEAVLKEAVEQGADLLIVHHGLFWGGLAPLTGASARKARLCLDNNLAVYSVHLPLDAHGTLGNNTLLCDALGLPTERERFLDLGWKASVSLDRSDLLNRLEKAVGGRAHLAPGGPEKIERIGVVTGGAGGNLFKAVEEGVDTFITGEGPHWTYTAAEEAGLNLFYAGHYATETFGVRALGAHLEKEFGLPWQFIEHPTGL